MKIIPLTSSVKEAGVSRTLQTNVSFESASFFTMLIFLSIEMSLDDHQETSQLTEKLRTAPCKNRESSVNDHFGG